MRGLRYVWKIVCQDSGVNQSEKSSRPLLTDHHDDACKLEIPN